ncbi:MAG TPA: helix-turn-helix domain-containing protein [Solirubrobacteraceae bacterium]|jgi:sugar diacid utilization regulator|nr:helix-turn-helix domain-containing protein [Solirubrobacteraceae bacterium]
MTTRLAVPTRRGEGPAEVQFPGRAPAPPADAQTRLLDTLSETHAAMMDAVLDGEGMERVAELAATATGGPVAVLIPRLGVASAPRSARSSGELASLEVWVEERVRGRPSAVPAEVVAEAPIRFREEIVGVVALLRSEAPPRLEAGEFLRLAAAAALTALAIEDAKEETEQNLRGSLLEELRSRTDLTGPEIVRRAARLRCDLSGGAVILCAELAVDRPRLVVAMITAEHPGALAQELEGVGPDARPRVYAALPTVGAGEGVGGSESSMVVARRLATRLQRYGTVGMSSFHADPAELGCAVREAELVLEALQHSGTVITHEIGRGIYKLLFRVLASHPEEVHEFYETTVASMVRYDELNQTELVHTLWAYLDSNCNMNATAAAIFTHRHTVMHRLERIHELTGLDPTLCGDREQLGLGLKVHRLLAPALAR